MTDKTKTIRDLNDRFRSGDATVPRKIFMTSGAQMLSAMAGDRIEPNLLTTVQQSDDFSPDNDPYGEHDFGSFTWAGARLFFKIDYYAPDLEHGSEDPTDLENTIRVLTIMLAEEY